MNNRRERKGIVYLAFGYEYLLMAAHSASMARRTNPDIICEVITNVRFDPNQTGSLYGFDRATFVERDSAENRYIKTNIIDYTDLDYAVYIDGDTEVRGSLDPIFRCLEKFDLAIRLCSKPTTKKYEVAPGVPSDLFPEWNGGVVFFRNNERSRIFFRRWSERFRREGKNRDQPALARTVYETEGETRLLSLNAVWNTLRSDLSALPNGLDGSRIWHYRMAEKFPEVAPHIYEIHELFRGTVAESNPRMKENLEEVGRRYRFLSSAAYRLSCWHPRLRKRFIQVMGVLMKWGWVRSFQLARESQVAGESYQVIDSRSVVASQIDSGGHAAGKDTVQAEARQGS